MILSDKSIRRELLEGNLRIDPPPLDEQIQPASIDLTLGEEIKWTNGMVHKLDEIGHILYPGKFVLGHTRECVRIPNHLVAQLNGKSSLARQGLMIHITAGYIDPGFRGHITLELRNVGHNTIQLKEGMLIAQLVLVLLTEPAERPYGSSGINSHYQDQRGATLARA